MSRIILLDAGPLGLVTNPRATTENRECNLWLQAQLGQGVRVLVPEIADYEVRRELLRAGKSRGLARLDALSQSIGYVPLTTNVMRQAAVFWAQAQDLNDKGHTAIIATTNVKHLTLFVDARLWRDI